jgi:hypothetical protein
MSQPPERTVGWQEGSQRNVAVRENCHRAARLGLQHGPEGVVEDV